MGFYRAPQPLNAPLNALRIAFAIPPNFRSTSCAVSTLSLRQAKRHWEEVRIALIQTRHRALVQTTQSRTAADKLRFKSTTTSRSNRDQVRIENTCYVTIKEHYILSTLETCLSVALAKGQSIRQRQDRRTCPPSRFQYQ